MKQYSKKVLIIVQARMGATRLPGKPLKKILNKTLLSFLLERLKKVLLADQIVIATSDLQADEPIREFCRSENVSFFSGSETDVLDRFYQTALKFPSNLIVRITADCPLMDPQIVDTVIKHSLDHPEFDYVTNTLIRTYPRGMDVEVFTFEALSIAAKNASLPFEREHVTPYFYEKPSIFKCGNVHSGRDIANYRLTVDTPEDLQLIKEIIEYIYPKKPHFTLEDVLNAFKNHPHWLSINANIHQKKLGE